MTTTQPWTRRLLLTACLAGALGACSAETPAEPADPDAAAREPAAEPADAESAAQLVATYDKGLDFLTTTQEGGIWKMQGHPDPGSTAMAITVFLKRPGGVREKDAEVVSKGLAFLSASLGEDGGVVKAYSPNYMTSAVIGALAASGDEAYDAKIAAAAAYIKKLQFLDDDLSYGGIGYGSDKTRSDLSNTQFALGSLRAAGIGEDDPAFQAALKFLARTHNRKENETPGEPTSRTDDDGNVIQRSNDGGANYRPFDSKAGVETLPDGTKVTRSYGSMTYALLRCYHLCGLDASDGRVQATVDWVRDNWTLDVNPGMPEDQKLNGLFYYYMTMARALTVAGIGELETTGGKQVDWRKELSARLVSLQKADGSWINDDPRWMEAEPLIATTYTLLALADCSE